MANLSVPIGQMFIVGFRGTEPDEHSPILRDIREKHLGGVILFDTDTALHTSGRNIVSPDQLKRLVSGLQDAAETPLLIAMDQEGGQVARLKETAGFPPTVSAEFLGKQDNPALTRQEAARIADTLAALGVNLNLAPVVDVNVNPASPAIGKLGRSFSPDPAVVTRHALAFIEAHRERRILCAPKHFPGHGSAGTDTHEGITDVTDTWKPIEMAPFANLIMQNRADAIMTAHVFNKRLDPDYPATLSRKILSGQLRAQFGFQGVIITDDLQMGAIARDYSLETALLLAIEAGADLLLLANNSTYDPDIVSRAIRIVEGFVEENRIPESRLAASWERILRLKGKMAALPPEEPA